MAGEVSRVRREDPDLVRTLLDLAALPDDDPDLQAYLDTLVQTVLERVRAADYASITARRDGGYSTVAMSGELALAVDEAQYADGAGPCLEAVEGAVTGVADVATVVQWPGFRDAAITMGLRSSLSIPLFTASGAPSIALNLYAHQPRALVALGEVVDREYYRRRVTTPATAPAPSALDEGSRDLVRGLVGALDVRALIQQAIGVVMQRDRVDAARAYVALRLDAADAGVSIRDHAETLTKSTRQTG